MCTADCFAHVRGEWRFACLPSTTHSTLRASKQKKSGVRAIASVLLTHFACPHVQCSLHVLMYTCLVRRCARLLLCLYYKRNSTFCWKTFKTSFELMSSFGKGWEESSRVEESHGGRVHLRRIPKQSFENFSSEIFMFLKLLFYSGKQTCLTLHATYAVMFTQFRMHCCQSYMLEASGGHVKDLAMLWAFSSC